MNLKKLKISMRVKKTVSAYLNGGTWSYMNGGCCAKFLFI